MIKLYSIMNVNLREQVGNSLLWRQEVNEAGTADGTVSAALFVFINNLFK